MSEQGSSGTTGGDGPGPAGFSGRQLRELIADDAWLDEVIDRADEGGVSLTGPGGFLPAMIKAVLERGLAAELTDHLGYEVGDGAGRGSGNSRNGHTPKTVQSEIGPMALDVPRDRQSTFEPALIPKGERRLRGLDDMIISLYAGGMTVRDIGHHLARTVGTELSHDTISRVTDAVLEEVKIWQHRPLDAIYPIVYIDALVVKIRDGAHVRNKAAHLVVGVDLDGIKHVLGIWVAQAEGAKFWAGVCAELANRGVTDILIACCDGLTGLPEAIEATFPRTTVQTCVVHLIRASMRFVSYNDRKKLAAALKPVYTAPNADAAETALLELAESDLGQKYKAAVATWQNAWDRFTPFLAFPPEVRKIIYTTNAIVISSPLRSVADVCHAASGVRLARAGGGYLRPVHDGLRRRFDVGAAGGPTWVAGRVLDGAGRGRPTGRTDRAVSVLPDRDRTVTEHCQGLCA